MNKNDQDSLKEISRMKKEIAEDVATGGEGSNPSGPIHNNPVPISIQVIFQI
jgi:hypothetical protein